MIYIYIVYPNYVGSIYRRKRSGQRINKFSQICNNYMIYNFNDFIKMCTLEEEQLLYNLFIFIRLQI